MASSAISAVPQPPGAITKWLSMKPTLIGGSSSRDGTRSGRTPANIASSATRAERLAERTDAKVAPARTRVPPAVDSDEMITQLGTGPQ
jgi:hypothetical protein